MILRCLNKNYTLLMTFKIVVTYDWLMVNNILLFIYLILKNYQRNLITYTPNGDKWGYRGFELAPKHI
jgi:hypothetical protein